MRKPPAIILAAGKASRMKPYSLEIPKSLFELAPNLTVMDLTVRWLEEEGIKDIVIVTRPSLEKFFSKRYGDKVRVVTTDMEDGFANLYSFLTGARAVTTREFLVIMSDHIFEPEILRRLLRGGGDRAFTLCLDRNPPWDKIEEGLKVVLEDGEIREVGKKASPYYGIDTGLFYCTARAIEIAEETIHELGLNATIADALRRAIRYGEVSYVEVTDLLWMDVDTPEELEEARKLLPALLRRSLIKPGDGPVSRHINRPVSTRISVFLFLRGIYVSPNLISILSFLLALLSSILIVRGLLIAAAILIQLSSIIDGVDGEVARLFGTANRFGGLLDSLLDRYADLLIIAGMGSKIVFETPLQVALFAVAAGNIFITSYVSHLAGWSSDRVINLRSVSPASRDVRLLIAALLTAFNLFWPFILYMVVVPLAFSLVLLAASKMPEKPIKVERRKPVPHVEIRQRPRRKITALEANLKVLLASSIKLLIFLVVIRLIYGLVADLDPIGLMDFSLRPITILNFLELVVIVYFGYRIMLSSKFFLDLLSKWLVRKMGIVTEVAVKRALADLLYLIVIALLIWFLPGYLGSLPLGSLTSKLSLIFLLFLFLLVFYDLAKLFYRSFKGFFDRQIARIAERLTYITESGRWKEEQPRERE